MSTPQQGWYDDPTAPGRLRWWNGTAWTEQTRVVPLVDLAKPPASSPEPSTTPTPPSPPAPEPAGPAAEASARRSVVVAALIGLAVVVLGAALAFGVFVGSDGNVFDLTVGLCFDDGDTVSDEDVHQVDAVPIVACSEAHDNEVFATFDVDVAKFPGSASLEDLAVDGCFARFDEMVGLPVELSNLDVGTYWPTQESWEQGDREVLCFLRGVDGVRLVGSKLDLAARVGANVFSLREGDCFDAPLLDPGPEVEVAAVVIVECRAAHFGEVYDVFTLDQGPYPGRTELVDQTQDRCLGGFEPFVGEPWETSILYFNALPPTESSWEMGDRSVICYVYDLGNGEMVGSAREWVADRADNPPPSLDYHPDHLVVGDCFDDDFDTGDFPVIDCDLAHDNEVFGIFELADAEWPGRDEVLAQVRQLCGPALQDWISPDRDGIVWFSFDPSEENWADGDRRVVCALYDDTLEKLVGSQRREPV